MARPALRLPETDFKSEARLTSDSTAAFKSEPQLAQAAAVATRRRTLRNVGALALAVLVVGIGLWFGWQALKTVRSRPAVAAASSSQGTAVFNSSPDGASIVVDGVARGVTPLKLVLGAGMHSVTVTSNAVSRTLPLNVDAGAVVSQFVELAVQQAVGGRLEIGSEPPGADVRVDGISRGVAPVVVGDLAAGQHKITISNGDTTVNRTVNVSAGATATVVVSTAGPSAGSAGWLAIVAPFEMEVREGQQLVGTTRADRLMLPTGTHDLVIGSPDLEFASRRSVQIVAGKTATVTVPLPEGKLSVNAVPWADVSIDGRGVGTTPLGNLSVVIGSHEIVWRHPQLGERRQKVLIKAQSPTRIGVDFSK